MRAVNQAQSSFGQTNITDICIDPRSRDDIPAVLKDLLYIYVNPDLRNKVFTLLEDSRVKTVRQDTGRPGMELWRVFVLATLKLGLGCNYDRLQELPNQHQTLRQRLGHSGWEDTEGYALQTLLDYVSALKPDVLAEVNRVDLFYIPCGGS